MAKKKLTTMLAWTLTMAMAATPGNIIWAAEAPEEEFTESVAQGTDSQEELTAPEESQNEFTDESDAGEGDKVFSEGETEEETIINGVGEYTLKTGTTYQVNLNDDDDVYCIEPSEGYTVDISNNGQKVYPSKIVKFKSDGQYTMVVYDEEDDYPGADSGKEVIVTIRKFSGIKTIEGTFNSEDVYPLETQDSFAKLPIKITLNNNEIYDITSDASWILGEETIGEILYVYLDANGNPMWDENGDPILPSQPGEYKYYFYWTVDPSVKSKIYTRKFGSFEEVFRGNTFDNLQIELTHGIDYDNGFSKSHNYGFVINGVDDGYYSVNNDCDYNEVALYCKDEEGRWQRSQYRQNDGFKLEKNKRYYAILSVDEDVDANLKSIKLNKVDYNINITWENAPTDVQIVGNRDFSSLRVKVTYDDGKEEIISEKSAGRLGYLKCEIENSDENEGQYYVCCTFSKRPDIFIKKPVQMESLDDIKSNLPEINVNDYSSVPHNYGNCNLFKFTAPVTGEYKFNVTGSEALENSESYVPVWIEDAEGKYRDAYIDRGWDIGSIQLKNGETAYVFATPYAGEINVKTNAITSVKLLNQEELPYFYKEFFEYASTFPYHGDWELVDKYYENAKFDIELADNSKKTLQGMSKVDDTFGEIYLVNEGDYDNEENSYNIPVGVHPWIAAFTGIDSRFNIGELTIHSLEDIANGIDCNLQKEYIVSNSQSEVGVKHFYIENSSTQKKEYQIRFNNFAGSQESENRVLIAGKDRKVTELSLNNNTGNISLEPNEKLYFECFGKINTITLIDSQILPPPAPVEPDPGWNPTPDPNPVPTQTPTPTPSPTPTATPTPEPTPSPIPTPGTMDTSAAPEIDSSKITGNQANVKIDSAVENAEGYDFVLCVKQKDLNAKKYVDVRKNMKSLETTFSYVKAGTYYVYCHAWIKVNGKKVFTEWSEPHKVVIKATTTVAPKIKSVKVTGRKVVVKLSKGQDALGIDIILGNEVSADQYGKRPINYGKQVKKNQTGTTITFTNVPKGTYYVGAHAFNRSAGSTKVFSKWSNIRKITV